MSERVEINKTNEGRTNKRERKNEKMKREKKCIGKDLRIGEKNV